MGDGFTTGPANSAVETTPTFSESESDDMMDFEPTEEPHDTPHMDHHHEDVIDADGTEHDDGIVDDGTEGNPSLILTYSIGDGADDMMDMDEPTVSLDADDIFEADPDDMETAWVTFPEEPGAEDSATEDEAWWSLDILDGFWILLCLKIELWNKFLILKIPKLWILSFQNMSFGDY